MRQACFAAAALLILCAPLRATADEGPGDCLGVDFNLAHPIGIAKIIVDRPRVYFVKSAFEDAACPADGDACLQQAYLVPGDLILIGKTHGAFTCVSYKSAAARKVQWTNGWVPAASMTPIKPAPAPSRADWIGNWVHAGGHIIIKPGKNGGLAIHGEAFYNAAQNVHTGVIDAAAKPAQGLLEFADDGSIPFDETGDDNGSCLVRMQRIEKLLVAEDNGSCGGVMVTFTGFYRSK